MKKIVIFILSTLFANADTNSTKPDFMPNLHTEISQKSSLADETQITIKAPFYSSLPTKENSVIERYLLNLSTDLYKFNDKLRLYGLFGLLHDEFNDKFAKDFNNTWGSEYGFGLRYVPNVDISISFGIKNRSKFFVPTKDEDDEIYTFNIGVNLGKNPKKSPKKINSVGEIPITKDLEKSDE